MAGTPKLLDRENTPTKTTLYVEIDISDGGNADPHKMTAIYAPDALAAAATSVNVILFLHGFRVSWTGNTIEEYFAAKLPSTGTQPFALREKVNDAKKALIFVAPTIGGKSGEKRGRRLVKDDAFAKDYLDMVMNALSANGVTSGTPVVGNIVLAAHSGGGVPMFDMTKLPFIKSKLKEVWVFDCFYNKGDDDNWSNWKRDNPALNLVVRYTTGGDGTADRSKSLETKLKAQKTVAAYNVQAAGLDHNVVPAISLTKLITDSKAL